MTLKRLLVALALLAALLVSPVLAAPAVALSCVEPSRFLKDASQVFRGTVADAEDGQVLIDVVEVWWGGPVDGRVWLDVGLEGWAEWAGPDGRIPDGFSASGEWVFAPDPEGVVNPCTMWPLAGHGNSLLEHRPNDPAAPVAVTEASESVAATAQQEAEVAAGVPSWLALPAGAGGLVLAVAAFLMRRRRAVD